MTRSQNRVKAKNHPYSTSTVGLIDLHFHGAFGIDIMTASPAQLNEMSHELWQAGVAAFCPTTLSLPRLKLLAVVKKLGHWIRQSHPKGALPVGIHLEGPFIHPGACGAHPPQSIRPFDWEELNELWEQSQETLKILTLAPEMLSPDPLQRRKTLSQLKQWSKTRKIRLSVGHSKVTEQEANEAFDLGFEGITHAWNALSFHHRDPGALGAGVGRPEVYLELIADQVHLSPTVIRWLLQLHRPGPVCMISDCLAAGGTRVGHRDSRNSPPRRASFGPLQIQYERGASRFSNGSLAGGGQILTESYCRWLKAESAHTKIPLLTLFRRTLRHVTSHPLQVLGLSPKLLENRRVMWHIFSSNRIRVIPID